MLSNKPYLIRAFYEWIVDSNCTPYIVINALHPHCQVPQDYVENGEITLNISPTAVRDLKILNNIVEFKASFSGAVHLICVPIKAVLAIYAQENQQGMFFDFDEDDEEGGSDSGEISARDLSLTENKANEQIVQIEKLTKSHLKLVE